MPCKCSAAAAAAAAALPSAASLALRSSARRRCAASPAASASSSACSDRASACAPVQARSPRQNARALANKKSRGDRRGLHRVCSIALAALLCSSRVAPRASRGAARAAAR